MANTLEIRLGQLLIKKRHCTLQEINQAIDLQASMKEKGEKLPLEALLIQESIVEEDKIFQALAEMGILHLICEPCRQEIEVKDYDSSKEYVCPKCQSPLMFSTNSSGTRRDPSASFRVKGAFPNGLDQLAQADLSEFDPANAAKNETNEPNDDPIIDKMINGCQVIKLLAQGGMGKVYLANQFKLGRRVAVKILSEELARDPSFVHRFLQEARAAAELSHGNIVQIFDVGEITGYFFIIMEFVDGPNLKEILKKHTTISPLKALEVVLQACHALKHAHQRGVIHRDIKPENIMMTQEAVVKIADLGLAKKIASSEQDGGITNSGAILGTPYYMAPEQIKDFSRVDGRSDIYSLGVTLFKALTGKIPFNGRSPVEIMIKVVDGKRPSLRSICPEIPEDVELLVDKMMHCNPDRRYQDLSQVIKDMEQVLFRLRGMAEQKKKDTDFQGDIVAQA